MAYGESEFKPLKLASLKGMSDESATDDKARENEADAEGAEGDGEEQKSGRKMPGKKLVLFVVAPLLLLIVAGAGVYFSGLLDSFLGGSEKGAQESDLLAEEPTGPPVYYELPEMLVNLNTGGRKTGYLKISISLELATEEDVPRIEQSLPRVVDNFQVYLRELRIQDLQGSAGLQRLREELLLRVATAAYPAQVRDVLFREMLIQ